MRAGLFYLFETLGEKSPRQAYKEAVDQAVYGEELGFEAVCPAEHHFSAHYGIMPDVLDYLSWVSSRTEKIKLWPMVIVSPLNETIRLAERVAMLDQFSGGRVVFSVGSGYRSYEFEPFGLDIKDNWKIMREQIEFCVKAWKSDGNVSYDGQFLKIKNVEIQPKTLQKPHPPVFITTARDEQIAWAAERGFYVIPAAGFSPWELSHVYDLYDKLAQESGFGKSEYKVFFKWIYVDSNDKRAREYAEKFFMKTIMAFFYGGEHLYKHLTKKLIETWPEERRDEIKESRPITFDTLCGNPNYTPLAWGDPKRVIDFLSVCRDAGANFFIGGFNMGAMDDSLVRSSMKLFMEKVIPYV